MRDNGQRIERDIQYLDPKNEQLPINKHGIADTGTVFYFWTSSYVPGL